MAALTARQGWQPADTARDLLACYGIPVVATRLAGGADDAVAAADAIGYPVVLKAAAPDLVHKSDVGAVRLNLDGPAAVRDAYATVAAALGAPRPAVMVQRMAQPGVELVAGVVHDPLFGSLVMLGLGGVYTDLLADRAFRLLPLTDLDTPPGYPYHEAIYGDDGNDYLLGQSGPDTLLCGNPFIGGDPGDIADGGTGMAGGQPEDDIVWTPADCPIIANVP